MACRASSTVLTHGWSPRQSAVLWGGSAVHWGVGSLGLPAVLLLHSLGCTPGSCSVCCIFSPSSLLAHLQPVEYSGVIPAQVQGFTFLAIEFPKAPVGSSLWRVREFWMAAQPSGLECAGLSTGLSEVCLYHIFGLCICSLLCFLT